MKNFPLIDLHQDILAHLHELKLFPNGKQTDFELLKTTNIKLVAATAFPLPPDGNYFTFATNELIESDFREYIKQTQTDSSFSIVRSADDLRRVLASPEARGILLHVEGLNGADENIWARLQTWFDLGWRSLGPVWNLTNSLGGGTNDPMTGLTALGCKLISWLQARRMVVDFAHMNRPTFWDAAELISGPIYVSHGNSSVVFPSPRNLDDEQLRVVSDSGGLVGIMFPNSFVVGREKRGTVSDVADHVEHFVKIMGLEHVAIGSDFGGILSGLVEGLGSLDKLSNLWTELARRGFTDDELECIAWKNAARVLLEIL